jgi:CRP-like cAMP-binding protein
MDNLLQRLVNLTRLPDHEIEPVLQYFEPVNISAKAILLRPGEKSRTAWLIGSGILRAYSLVEEDKRSGSAQDSGKRIREVTNWIVAEGDFFTDLRSFIRQKPATCFIETLEDCTLYKIRYESYLIIQQSFPIIARTIFEKMIIRADQRVQMSNFRDPVNRLRMFEEMYPGMSGRISVIIQASYLNIDRETLSRLRRRNKI